MAVTKEQADRMLTQAYTDYMSLLTAFCKTRLRECPDMVEDCVQKAYLFYYNKMLDGEEIQNAKAYLYRVADNICKEEKSKYIRREMRTADIELAEEVSDPLQDFELERDAADLDYDEIAAILISNLSKEEQRLFAMKYVERKSLEEIGELLDMKPNTVAKRLSRMRVKIKELATPVLENYRKGG